MNNGEINKKSLYIVLTTFFFIAGIIILLIFLLHGNETLFSEQSSNVQMSALYCNASEPEHPFFTVDTAVETLHEIKVIFRAEQTYRISYNYYGTFTNRVNAEKAAALLHGDYNIYMGQHSMNAEMLFPTFINSDLRVKINLYGEKSQVNSTTGILFFLNADESSKFNEYDIESLNSIYKNKGFECDFKNNKGGE